MNRNDRLVATAALVVALLALTAVFLIGHFTPTSTNAAAPSSGSDSLAYSGAPHPYSDPSHRPPVYYNATPVRPPESFPFDPNTADSTQLLRLGLQPWQVRSLYKYRAHGGVFRRKEDFARLYGLTVKDYRRLEPYIRISHDYQPAATLVKPQERYERDTLHYPVKMKADERIVLNTADTAQLRRVPGIGTYYAKEIISHGKWLGGYVSVDQLDEIDGFPQEAKQYFIIENAHPRRLNINRLSLAELRRHPYINFYQAKAIVDYRRLHGDIHSLNDLRFSRDFTDEAINRLEPYVEY